MKFIVAIVAVVLGLATTALWIRVRELEESVDALTGQLNSRPKVVSTASNSPADQWTAEKQRIFKLIESAPANGGATEIGVPWSVERGMLLDAAERNVPIPQVETGPPEYKVEGAPPVDMPSDEWRLEKPPTGPTSDGGTD